MRFLMAGFGSIGRRHFRNLLSLGERDILFLRSGKSTLSDDELRGFVVEGDIHAALSHNPDAVIVSNPTALHLDMAIPAAEQGCSLLLEKPISHSLDRVDYLRRTVIQGGGAVLVGFQFRYHPGLIKAKQLIDDGVIGKILAVQVHWGEYLPGWHPWEDYRQGYAARHDLGGGVALTLSHPFDYLRWMVGEIAEVQGKAGKVSDLEIDVPDVADAILRFDCGAVGHVHLNFFERPTSHWVEIIGSEGKLAWDQVNGGVRWYPSQSEEWLTYALPESFERNQLFLEEIAHFIDVAHGNAVPRCNLEDGVRALEIALQVEHKVGGETHV